MLIAAIRDIRDIGRSLWRVGLTGLALACPLAGCGGARTENVAQAADNTADAIANRAEEVRRMADEMTANVETMPGNGIASNDGAVMPAR